MEIIGYRYHKLNLFILLAIGLFLILFGFKLIFQSSFNYNDFNRFSGSISRIEIIGNKQIYDGNRLEVQLKNYNNTFCFNNIQLNDKLKIGDYVTVYAKHDTKFNKGQEIMSVYGLYLKNDCLIDLVETSRVNRWIGILLIFLGLILIFGALINYRFINKGKYKYIDIDVNNLPYY